MPDTWTTVAAAAAALNVHPRTIERRMASGKLQSRRTDDGQVQVLVDLPDTPEPGPDPLETVKELAQDQVTLATGSASALVKFAQDDALRARSELELVRQDAHVARRGARFAWSSVAIMAACVCAAVGWTAHTLTKSEAEVRRLTDRAVMMELESRKLSNARDEAVAHAEASKLKAAEADGRLAAYVEQSEQQTKALAEAQVAADSRPTTRPATLIQRLASVIAEE